MAYTDMFDQYFDPVNEEERRKRLERERAEAEKQRALIGNTEVQSQQVKTYADGSQEHITTQQMPAPVAPVAPVAPPMIEQPPVQQAPAEQMQPRAPVAQLHPDHQAAIDRVMPPANGGQAQTMPVQQAPVQQAPVQQAPVQQAPVQQAPVVPVAPVAPQQVPIQKSLAPNEQIVPVNPAAPQPKPMAAPAPFFSDARQQVQDMENGPRQSEQIVKAYDILSNSQADKLSIGKIAYGDYPPHMRAAAESKLDEIKRQQSGMSEGEKMMAGVQAGDPKAVRKFQKEISNANEGSWSRLILAGLLGNKEAQTIEFAKLGIGTTTTSYMGEDNKEYMVTTDAKGNAIRGINEEGGMLNSTELSNLGTGKGRGQAGATRVRDAQGTEWSVVPTQTGSVFYDNARKRGVPVGKTIPINVGSDVALAGDKAFVEAEQKVLGGAAGEGRDVPKRVINTGSVAPVTGGQLRNNNPGNIRYGQMAKDAGATGQDSRGFAIFPDEKAGYSAQEKLWTSPAYKDLSISQSISKWAPNTENKPGEYARTIKQKTGLDMDREFKDLSPTEKQNLLRAQAEIEHGVKLSGGGATPTTGGNIPLYKQKEQDELNLTENKEIIQSNRKYSDTLAKNLDSASAQKSTINRLQTSIDKNPEFWGIDTNSPAWRAFVDVNSTNENKAISLDTLARNLNIPQNKWPEFNATMNDYRNLQVNAITSSGLTASQLNTERESQRVVNTAGSISDKPTAAKAALEYAKAKIEYTDAKARAWIQARKANRSLDQLEFEADFDATQGEQIFKSVNERMEKMIGGKGGAGGPKEGATDVSKSGKPMIYRNGRWEYK